MFIKDKIGFFGKEENKKVGESRPFIVSYYHKNAKKTRLVKFLPRYYNQRRLIKGNEKREDSYIPRDK